MAMSDAAGNGGTVERRGDCELEVKRQFKAPRELLFRAWSEPDLFRRWWVPKSVPGLSLVSCEMDVRTGGGYRLDFRFGSPDTTSFYGKYIEVVPGERIVWTNDEGEDGGVTTVSFESAGSATRLTYHERHPSADALEEAIQGSAAALPEQLDQLEAMLAGLANTHRT